MAEYQYTDVATLFWKVVETSCVPTTEMKRSAQHGATYWRLARRSTRYFLFQTQEGDFFLSGIRYLLSGTRDLLSGTSHLSALLQVASCIDKRTEERKEKK